MGAFNPGVDSAETWALSTRVLILSTWTALPGWLSESGMGVGVDSPVAMMTRVHVQSPLVVETENVSASSSRPSLPPLPPPPPPPSPLSGILSMSDTSVSNEM